MPVLVGSPASAGTGASVYFESASELATIRKVFTVDTTPTDPTTVTLVITSPGGAVTTFNWPSPSTVTRNGTGDFAKDVACSEHGEWQYIWTGTGTVQDADAGSWTVYEADIGKLYCTPQALKSRLGIADSVDDYEIYAACYSASRAIEHYCERHFWRTPTGTARTFVPQGMYLLKLPEFNDLVSISALRTDASGDGVFETAWAPTDYQPLTGDGTPNIDAAPEPRPYTRVKAVGTQLFPHLCAPALSRADRIQITGVWGWPSVPWGIRQAALILAEETLKLKDAPFGVAGFGEFGSIRVRQNPKVRQFCGPFMRNPVDDKDRKLFVA